MHLSNIKLWNYRKFGSTDATDYQTKPHLDLNLTKGLNVIIGENDSGKTAIIEAIKLVLKTHSYDYVRVDEKDFYRGTDRFRIELTFEDLVPDEAKNFTEWLGWGGEKGKEKPILKLNYDVKRQADKILPSDVKAGADEDGYLLTAEAREYLKATYLKPLRDAENELVAKRNSRLSQILIGDEAFKGKEKDNDLIRIFSGLKKELENYFNGIDGAGQPKATEGKLIKDKIDNYIQDFYSKDNESEFESTSTDIKSILEKLTLTLKGEPNPGLGTLNRLFMAAELLHLTKSNWTGLRLGLVEELEAHLHPQAQMQVIEAFQKQVGIQLILTSHSPNLASKVKLEHIIFCAGSYAYPMGANYTKLKSTDYPFLERFLDVTKANLFFAKGVILVEGTAEEIIIPSLAYKMFQIGIIKRDLTNAKVSIVSINNTSFLRYSNIFKRLKHPHIDLPVAVVNDIDLRPTEFALKYNISNPDKKKRAKIISEFNPQEEKENKEKKINGQSIKAFVSNHWTLEYCIALHPHLKKLLFYAVHMAIEENRADNYKGNNSNKYHIRSFISLQPKFESKWKSFIFNKTIEEIAFQIMHEYIIDNKKLSKAVIAMYFSELLSNDISITENMLLTDDNPIGYLIEAIKYATNN